MAQYFIDPAGGQAELDRFNPKHGETGKTITVVDDAGIPAFKLPFFTGVTAYSFEEAGQFSDCEVAIIARTDINNNSIKASAAARVGGTVFDTYAAGIIATDRISLSKVVGGTKTAFLDSIFPAGINELTYTVTRLRLTGTTLEYKGWDLGSAEPSTWQSFTDSDITAAGFPGFLVEASTNVWIAGWGLGTNGDSAPTSAADLIQQVRKGSQFTVEETLAGNVVSATLNGNAITVDSHVGTTVTLTDSGGGITTSGEYPLVLTDDSATPQTETITLQVNVVGVAPSNNPVQKDGAALASLTDVQVRVTSGASINGTELFYSGTATTDASGNLSNIDLSSTAATDTDPVLLHMRTAAGDSIIASETVGLI